MQVCGPGGFIGCHLVQRLKRNEVWVRWGGLEFSYILGDGRHDSVVGDLRDQGFCRAIVDRRFDEVYQLAADMGSRLLHLYRRARPPASGLVSASRVRSIGAVFP